MQISFSDLSFGSVGAVERRILQIDPAKESKDGAGKAAGDGLDETDRLIVAQLKQNARISNVELAKRVNLSPTPCYERVRKLERTGVLMG